jgi:hypothetical protein
MCGRNEGAFKVTKLKWGAAAIGAVINRTPKQTYYLLNKGLIRSAQKIGDQWVADEDDLKREFSVAAGNEAAA